MVGGRFGISSAWIARQMRADPDHDADQRDRGPQAEHRAPIEQAADAGRAARLCDWRLPPLRLARGLRSRGGVVVVVGLAFGE